MEVGKFSAQGMAKGLEQHTQVVTKSAETVGKEAILALQKSISGVKMGADLIDSNPTIRPVIDLTDVEKQAGKISKLLPSKAAISVGTAYDQALAARRTYDSNKDFTTMPVGTPAVGRAVQFIQNNNSPKALSNAEIYRQTRNQISQAKGALTK
jgi:hypothetical protein